MGIGAVISAQIYKLLTLNVKHSMTLGNNVSCCSFRENHLKISSHRNSI